MSRFRVKGVNDERSECECCGKTGLKRVVWIEDTETLEIRHFGTSCAESPAKAFGLTREIRAAVRSFVVAEQDRINNERQSAIREACRVAIETFQGEWNTTTVEHGPMRGREIRTPVDVDEFNAHKSRVIASMIS